MSTNGEGAGACLGGLMDWEHRTTDTSHPGGPGRRIVEHDQDRVSPSKAGPGSRFPGHLRLEGRSIRPVRISCASTSSTSRLSYRCQQGTVREDGGRLPRRTSLYRGGAGPTIHRPAGGAKRGRPRTMPLWLSRTGGSDATASASRSADDQDCTSE